MYILWDELDTTEPVGWYRAVIVDHHRDGTTLVEYSNGSTEILDLRSTPWELTRKNAKSFVKPSDRRAPPPKSSHPKSLKYALGKEHKITAFADDMSIITSTQDDHQSALRDIDNACNSIFLHLKPSKCVSIVLENGSIVPNRTFHLVEGTTRSISKGPTKFLGQTIASSNTLTKRTASAKLAATITSKLKLIDARPIRGEMKLWILQHLLIPSTHFHLAVNNISPSTIANLENITTRYVKKWLGLPRNASRVIFNHPAVINLPPFRVTHTIAKISLLINLSHSTDPSVLQLCENLLLSQSTLGNVGVCEKAKSIHRKLTPSLSKKNQKKQAKFLLLQEEKERCEGALSNLQVQGKFTAITHLEEEASLWRRIMDGLPKGQLSFLLRAGSDTLPSPMNLHRWRLRVSPACPLCHQSPCTTAHILVGCPHALEDGRYTWRHDSVLMNLFKSILHHLNPLTSPSIYADLPGLRAWDNPPMTIPPSTLITTYRPDIVVTDNHHRQLAMLKLTVCGNTPDALQAAHSRKSRKAEYLHIVSDLIHRGWSASYTTIEIGCLGHYCHRAPSELQNSCNLLSHLPWEAILRRASPIAINCSQAIFMARRQGPWPSSKQLLN